MRVFVTGGTGAIGRHAVPALVEAGHTVTALARTPEKAAWVRGPGRLALLFGNRLTSLTRSLRVSNARFRAASGWAPVHRSAREGWVATATALT